MSQPTTNPVPETPWWIHNSCIVAAVACPLAMLLPPRRFDLRFLILSSGFSLSTNQLAHDYTGQSLYSRFTSRLGQAIDAPALPAGARATQARLREEMARRDAGLPEEERERRRKEREGPGSKLKDIWYGGEGEDWKKKRDEEDKKALEEGKGISGIIIDQIQEVWRGSKKDEKGDDKGGPEKKD